MTKIYIVLIALTLQCSLVSPAFAAANITSVTANSQSSTLTYSSAGSTTFSTVTGSGQGNGNITWSTSGLPSGAAASFSPASSSGNGSWGPVLLTVSISNSTPAGVYAFNITGTGGRVASVTKTLTISRADQSVSFSVPPKSVYSPGLQFVIADAKATSLLPVTFRSGGSCVSSGNVITVVSAGTCFISATQVGDSNYNPTIIAGGEQRSKFDVVKANQTISGFSAPSGPQYTGQSVIMSALSDSNQIIYRASGACSVSGQIISLNYSGTCAVSASAPASKNY